MQTSKENVCIKMNGANKCGCGQVKQNGLFYCHDGEMVANELDLPAATQLRGGLLLVFDLSPGFSFCREPSRALEPGQCHQPDIVVQTVHARLQRGGIMQHHQRLPGHRRAPFRDAGVHAAA